MKYGLFLSFRYPSCSKSANDQAVSSEGISQASKNRCLEMLSRVCHSHNVLPPSCIILGVVSIKKCGVGAFTDIHEGKRAGKPIRILTFRPGTAANTENLKRVCVPTVPGEAKTNSNVLLKSGSTLRL